MMSYFKTGFYVYNVLTLVILFACLSMSYLYYRLNREAKQNLEMDWSDKKEALEIDTVSGALKNHNTNKQFYPGAAKFQEM